MKIKTPFVRSLVTVAIAAATVGASAAEPIEPIAPVKEINLALVELGKKLALEIAPAVFGDAEALAKQDPSTQSLVSWYLENRD